MLVRVDAIYNIKLLKGPLIVVINKAKKRLSLFITTHQSVMCRVFEEKLLVISE